MAAPHVARRDNCLARQAVQESASKAIEGDWATAWHGASVAFRKRPQSDAHRLFTGPTAKVRSGSTPASRKSAKDLVVVGAPADPAAARSGRSLMGGERALEAGTMDGRSALNSGLP